MSSPQMSQAGTVWWLVVAALITAAPLLHAAPPAWWTTRGVLDTTKQANDYAAVNQGQVKFIAEQAAAELDANLPGGAGDIVHQIVETWGTPTATTNDYTIVNLGQLKKLAAPFYDQLIQAGYTNSYPWNGSLAQANDYAAANTGQVKNLFSFNITYDSDSDGLPDWWERHWFGHLGVNSNQAVSWSANVTILQAYQQGLNPIDYYSGHLPALVKSNGDNQTGPPNGFVPLPLIIQVTDNNGNSLPNAPVTFSVTSGGGQLQQSSSAALKSSLSLLTDTNGQAQIFFQLPATPPNATFHVIVTAASGSQSITASFTEQSDDSSGTYASPFSPTNVHSYPNLDASVYLTWENHTDDQTPVTVQIQNAQGGWDITTLPPGTTSYTIPGISQ